MKMFRQMDGERLSAASPLHISRSLLTLAAAWVLMAGLGTAQSRGSGEIRGTVLDPSGAVVPGAQITIQNTLTGVVTELTSGTSGIYDAESLIPGSYTVSFEKPGFRKETI